MTPEGAIVNSILDYLNFRGILAWRNNTGAVKIRVPQGRDRFLRYGKPGSSDILGVLPGGRILAVECKTATGRLSVPQRDFLASVSRLGGVAVIARSIEDVEKALESAGVAA